MIILQLTISFTTNQKKNIFSWTNKIMEKISTKNLYTEIFYVSFFLIFTDI
jgi:hypothetical protein